MALQLSHAGTEDGSRDRSQILITGAGAGWQKDKQTGIPSPDSLSQAMPPWLTGFYL